MSMTLTPQETAALANADFEDPIVEYSGRGRCHYLDGHPSQAEGDDD